MDRSHNNAESTDTPAVKLIELMMLLASLVMIGYHGLYLFRPSVNALLHQNIHLAMAFVLLSLFLLSEARSVWKIVLGLVLLAVGIFVTLYIHIHYERLHMWAGFPEFWDVIVGIVLVVMVTWFTYVHWGAIFPVLAGIAVAYAFFGHYLGGVIGHP